MFMAVSLPLNSFAQIAEDRVKAMWVYTLIPYITWPDAGKPATICTRGLDSVHDALIEIKDEKKSDVNIKEIGSQPINGECQLLYIANSEESNLSGILKQTQGKPILTVSSLYNFAGSEGIVEFIRSGNGVKLRINITNAKEAGLVINSDLLGVSEVVE